MHFSWEKRQGNSLKHSRTSKRFVNVNQLNGGLAAHNHLMVPLYGTTYLNKELYYIDGRVQVGASYVWEKV
jgi:hypothetical protein